MDELMDYPDDAVSTVDMCQAQSTLCCGPPADYTLFDLLDMRATREQSAAFADFILRETALQCSAESATSAAAREKRPAEHQLALAESTAEARTRVASENPSNGSVDCAPTALDTRDVCYTCAHCRRDILTPYDPHTMLPEELYYMVSTNLDSHSALHGRTDIEAPTNPNNIFCTADCFLAAWKIRAPNLPIVMYIDLQVQKIRQQQAERLQQEQALAQAGIASSPTLAAAAAAAACSPYPGFV